MVHPTNQADNPAAHAEGMPIVSVIGDGQLARMLHTEAIELGLSLRILASAADASAAQVTNDTYLGDYTNIEDLRAVAQDARVVTFEHEHVPNEAVEELIKEGINIQPVPSALVYAQDKLLMRQRLAELGAPLPAFCAINTLEDATNFYQETNGRVCVKARRGGYDGNGVWFPDAETELISLVSELLERGVPLMAEAKVDLVRELSVMVARTPSGATKTWPVVQSVQTNGICTEAIAPAPQLSAQLQEQTCALAERIASTLGVTGALAVELFEAQTADGSTEILVNELAMRPHNTGHWTQDGCVTSQFEQHLRAVLDLPLGATTMTAPVTVMANVLGGPENPSEPLPERMQAVWQKYPQAKIHFYGKTYRAGRKLGHVNISGEDVAATRAAAKDAAHYLMHATWM